jgi:hypothetical protein
VVVVVSEERGTISFCFNGNIAPDLQANQLRDMLFSIMSPKGQSAPRRKTSADGRDSSDRVTLGSAQLRKNEDVIAAVPPSTRPPPNSEAQPKPLRKSALPDEPTNASQDTDSMKVPAATPRPMPKASEVELKKDVPDDSSDESRRTPQ